MFFFASELLALLFPDQGCSGSILIQKHFFRFLTPLRDVMGIGCSADDECILSYYDKIKCPRRESNP